MNWTRGVAITLTLVAFIALVSPPIDQTLSFRTTTQYAQWTERAAIVINDDSKFSAENGVVSGSGTKLDPYIIEGWKIGQLTNGTAIDIRNTNVHFRIRNLYAYSCSIGVNMNSVHNGWVEDSQFIGNSVGVSFYKCDECKVVRSTIEGSDVAILISFSDVSQSDNTFINNDEDVQRFKTEMPWELTWVGATICAVILIPLAIIVGVLLFFRFKRMPPPKI